MDFCGAVFLILVMHATKGNPRAAARRSAKPWTRVFSLSDGTQVTHDGEGDGFQRFRIRSTEAPTNASSNRCVLCFPSRTTSPQPPSAQLLSALPSSLT